ncbi:hypothetical protein AB0894_06480 [Streptomyces sp. NPDC047916]
MPLMPVGRPMAVVKAAEDRRDVNEPVLDYGYAMAVVSQGDRGSQQRIGL